MSSGAWREWFGSPASARHHHEPQPPILGGVALAHYNGSTSSIRPVFNPYGSPAIRHYQESTCASSAVIRAGDPVTFDTVVTTHARIVKAPSSQGAVGNLLQNGIRSLVGIALADSTSDGSTLGQTESTAPSNDRSKYIPVALADGLTEFSIQISSVGAAPPPLAPSLIGDSYPLEINRTYNRWFLSSTNLSTAADLSIVVTNVPLENIGDTGGWVHFKFHSTMVHRSVNIGPSVT